MPVADLLEEGRAPRLRVIVPHDGLRDDLCRALVAAGYDVESRSGLDGSPYADRPVDLEVVDVEAPGAGAAFDGEARTPTLWLGGDRGQGPDVLAKPFSIDRLERRIADRLASRSTGSGEPREAILRSEDPAFRAIVERARRWATLDVSVVLQGELGTGRRSLARAMHEWSARRGEPFWLVDRAEIEADGEAQVSARVESIVAEARRGSLGLVEPRDWSRTAQAALARSLRRDAGRPRLLTLSRSSLEHDAREGALAEELHYRLEGFALRLPTLRERALDHAALCRATARRVARTLGVQTPEVDPEIVQALAAEGFPGNLLGLESRLRSTMIRDGSNEPSLAGMGSEASSAGVAEATHVASLDLKTLERDTIVRALAHWRGNRTRASESLGISVRTLRNKIRDYGLR